MLSGPNVIIFLSLSMSVLVKTQFLYSSDLVSISGLTEFIAFWTLSILSFNVF